MESISKERLEEALKQIESIIKKINNIDKNKLGKSQLTLIERRLDALKISMQLIKEKNMNTNKDDKSIVSILGYEKIMNIETIIPYKSIVFCVIDSIFSINSRYNPTTINVLERTAKYIGLKNRYEEYEVKDFNKLFLNFTPERLSEEVFINRQRTATNGGILKSEAVKTVLLEFEKIGVNTIEDFFKNENEAKKIWLNIKGQGSGITYRYLCMLAGNQNEFKNDRHIKEFFLSKLGYDEKLCSDYSRLKEVFIKELEKIKKINPKITIAKLDHMIWLYMSRK